VSENSLVCRVCGTHDLEAPAWIQCPHHMGFAVNCPRAGKGISEGKFGLECAYRCSFRKA
jgi:hypothetical protein